MENWPRFNLHRPADDLGEGGWTELIDLADHFTNFLEDDGFGKLDHVNRLWVKVLAASSPKDVEGSGFKVLTYPNFSLGGKPATMVQAFLCSYYPEMADAYHINLPQVAADHYILETLASGSIARFSSVQKPDCEKALKLSKLVNVSDDKVRETLDRLDKIANNSPDTYMTGVAEKAQAAYRDLVEKMAPVFYNYICAAVGGELRHVTSTHAYLKERCAAWLYWKHYLDKFGPEAMLYAAIIFMVTDSGSSYGGIPWAEAANFAYQYKVGHLHDDPFENKAVFVDRVIAMQHNCGSLLDKIEWGWAINGGPTQFVEYYAESVFGNLTEVLNAHSAMTPDFEVLSDFASPLVQDLLREAVSVADTFEIPLNVHAPVYYAGPNELEGVDEDILNYYAPPVFQEPPRYIPKQSKKPKLAPMIDWSKVNLDDYLVKIDEPSTEETSDPSDTKDDDEDGWEDVSHPLTPPADGGPYKSVFKQGAPQTLQSWIEYIMSEHPVNPTDFYPWVSGA